MKFKKILVYNIDRSKNLDPKSWKTIESFGEKIAFVPKDSPKLKQELADTDCVLVAFGTVIGKEEINAASKLKYIGVMATAFGKIDTNYAKKKKVIVSNLKGYSTESVAEFIFAAILEQSRGLEEGKRRGKSGNYSEIGISANEIKDKIFGVIGLGTIGKRVAEIALGFGANVKYWSKNRKNDYEKKGIKYEALDKLIKEADYLSINLAQAKETEKIFDKNRFQKVKSGAVLINTAPMELVDIDGLELRLKKGDITFILDHSDEMSEKDLKTLLKYKNCIIYPPIAYVSKEAAENRRRIFIENIEGFLKGKPQNVVN
ncbi:MAG: hypothetical protein A3D74_05385 [Candidatus Levybacteria bacterium RIFCSPHIGHO2_02_FULL_37_13]|nr:MAG: hypothetical protein A3D74_05385 [Candidatus Levybacteria bacterium RIFCSPHIGHO2_02_FULL_37_13]OGH30395.1 MAG: hypothetical protein A3E40_04120 [Candidatus Levybacteria bacterium RIFCSPHIGHO2_12_FULL_37_9]OGH40378.1 MAG: hypothetical protein A3B41_02610 [Candidatus Levybacteria bacterium RIFCSPLOWO2_01_FULL_37_26]